MTAQVPLAATAELHTAVNRLVKPTRTRLEREDRTISRVLMPSLWAQLCEAIQNGSEGTTHGVQTSKPPLDISALQLYLDITRTVRADCWAWRLKPTRITGETRRATGERWTSDLAIVRHDTIDNLWRIVAAVNAYGDDDIIDNLTWTVRTWTNQIATVISTSEKTWRMHHASCRVCGATTVPSFDVDGTETRQPAMVVRSDDGLIRDVSCSFCGSRLTGDDLTMLLLDQQRRARKRLRPFA